MEAGEKAADIDETRIEALASTLEGHERRLVLGHLTSLLIQRNDPRAYKLLDQVKPDDTVPIDLHQIVLRDPERLLNWVTSQNDDLERRNMAQMFWHYWGRADAHAAVAWRHALTEAQREQFGVRYTTDPSLSRLIDQP